MTGCSRSLLPMHKHSVWSMPARSRSGLQTVLRVLDSRALIRRFACRDEDHGICGAEYRSGLSAMPY
jgi:hypothetical protein